MSKEYHRLNKHLKDSFLLTVTTMNSKSQILSSKCTVTCTHEINQYGQKESKAQFPAVFYVEYVVSNHLLLHTKITMCAKIRRSQIDIKKRRVH